MRVARLVSILTRVFGWAFGLLSAIRGDWFGVLVMVVLLFVDAFMQERIERSRALHEAYMREHQTHMEEAMERMSPEVRARFEEALAEGHRVFRETMDYRWWHRFTRR